MLIVKKLTIDLINQSSVPKSIHAVRCDSNTRAVEVTLTAEGMPWQPPEGTTVSVAFKKEDGNKGWYDQLPDGKKACTVAGNVVTAILAPEVLTAPGRVDAAIVFQDATLNQLSTFSFIIQVAPNPAAGKVISNSYYKYSTMEAVNAAMVAHDNTIAELEQAKANGEFKGEKGDKGDKGDKGETGAQGPQGEKGDPGEVNIDDTKVGTDAWSSKNILDKLCPAFEETGPVVKCEPVGGYPLSAVSEIKPSANGRTGVNLWHCGKNLFNPEPMALLKFASFDETSGLWTIDTVTLGSGNNASQSLLTKAAGSKSWRDINALIRVPPNTKITVAINDWSAVSTDGTAISTMHMNVGWHYGDGTCHSYKTLKANSTILTSPDIEPCYLDIRRENPAILVSFSNIQIEISDTATAYESYRGETITLDFGETVYGGRLDWNSGVLTVTHGADGAQLAEPYTIQLTPQQINALEGLNVLCADAGNITVSGRLDPLPIIKNQKAINKDLLDRIAAVEAAVVNNI